MALKFFWRCEGATLDGTHDYSAGDTTATAGGSATISSSAARVGTNGVSITQLADNFNFTGTSLIDRTVGSLAFSVYITTWATGGILFKAVGSAGNDHIRVTMSGTDELAFRISAAGIGSVELTTTDANLATGAWYGVVCRWNHTNSDRRIEVYNSDGSLRAYAEDLSTGWTLPPSINTTLYVGDDGAANLAVYLDNIFIADAYDEPLEDYLDITSYTEYGGGGAEVIISSLSDDTLTNGQTGVIITGSGFEASQGGGSVVISPTDDVQDVNAITQTVTNWATDSITFTAVKGSLALAETLYLFVITDEAESNAQGYWVQFEPLVFIRETLVSLEGTPAANETGLVAYVWRADPAVATAHSQRLTGLTTNASGETNWQIDRGSLLEDDPVWVAIVKDGTPYRATMRRIVPVYE